jgi:PAS domain S-box-containing protein
LAREERAAAMSAFPSAVLPQLLPNAEPLTSALKAEIELRATETRLETALWGAGLGLWETDFRNEWTRWYSNWCQRLDLDPCEGRNHFERWDALMHPDDLTEAARRFGDHILGKAEYYESEYRIADQHGHWRWVYERGRVVERTGAGAPLRMVGVCLDIDARKGAELELRRGREGLEVALESARGAMWELDLDTGADPVHTEFFYRMLGEPVGPSRDPLFWSSRLHPEDRPRVRAALERAIAGQDDLYETEYRLRHTDGTWRWVHDRGRAPERAADGKAQRLVGFVVEITDRVHTQDELRRSEFRYRTVASMAPGYVFEYRFSEGGKIEPVWFSDGLQAVFGCSQEEFVRRGGWDAFVDPECEMADRLHRRRVRQGLPQSGEVRVRTADGRTKWLYASTMPLKDTRTGAATGFIGSAYDITARKLIEKQREALEREIIEIANREQQRIGGDLHDGLGQDLTGIALMLRGVHAQLRKENSAALLEVEDVLSLVNAAIDSTRALARGLSPVSPECNGLAAALQTLALHTAERHGIQVKLDTRVTQSVKLDEASATHLYRIAQEALTNVMRHSDATEVTIELATPGELLLLKVSDNGRGFRRPSAEGDGIGLKIMRYRAQVLGGDLSIEPGPEAGAIIACTLPLARFTAADAAACCSVCPT